MVLHLLGKKSWNVYNQDNIARVRRDEAQAKSKEEEEERLMQEADAERRIKILRGERPPTPPAAPRSPSVSARHDKKSHRDDSGRIRKRRRLAGENDTDRDIRYAQEDAQLALAKREELASFRSSEAPLHDDAGHINLFPSEKPSRKGEKNAEAEKESADKKRSYEDQYTMRFSNAAGFRQSIGQTPWYSGSGRNATAPEATSEKDVWGNEDPMRREREKARMDTNDPLAAMKKGVRQLKAVELERKKWNDERTRELETLRSAEKDWSHRRRRSPSRDSLDGFRLDVSPDRHRDDRDYRSHRRHHRHRHHYRRDQSREHSHRSHESSRSHSHRDRRRSRSSHDRRRREKPT